MKQKKLVIVFVLFVLSGAMSWTTYLKDYNQQDTVDIHILPNEMDGWVATELPISDNDYEILETRNALARKYTGPKGQVVYFFTVYSQYNRKVSHPPEVCYTGSGVKVVGNVIDSIDLPSQGLKIEAHKLDLEQRHLRQIAYYWYKIGESYTPSYWHQQIRVAAKNLIGKPEGSALIRVSTTVATTEEQAVADIKEFTRVILPRLQKYLP